MLPALGTHGFSETMGLASDRAFPLEQRTELKLEDKHRMVIQRDVGPDVSYTTRDVGLYLVVETSTGITVIWDKRTTIFIKLAPSYKVCAALPATCPLGPLGA